MSPSDAGVKPEGRGAADAAVLGVLEPIDAGPPRATWDGPYLSVTSSSTGIYLVPAAERSKKLGYARSGGRVPVIPEKVKGTGCNAGWYAVDGGGYICSADGTIDPEDPRARLALHEPDLHAVLPYPYARNAFNGTPLYSSVPSRDQMLAYEPHLSEKEKDSENTAPTVDAGARPWWQQKEAALHEVSLSLLGADSDGVLARRMVKGFYIAVAGEFEWSGRPWYKTTKGLVAPKDRFAKIDGSTFRGVNLDVDHALPVAWAYGHTASRPKFRLDESLKNPRPSGTFEKHRALWLSGEEVEINGKRYLKAKDGFWLRADHVRVARQPLIRDDIAATERWIHVDLHTQTLVALVGATPVYATLVSSGKESDDPLKDHRTPTGEWTLREKHVTTTMDGDGTAAGDLPYSIEDVPYAMYFQGSYALHGAFWHRNFGVRMSHGCINLAPLDAKYLFFFTGPPVPKGWHGAWAGNGQAGSRLIIDGPPPPRGLRAGR